MCSEELEIFTIMPRAHPKSSLVTGHVSAGPAGAPLSARGRAWGGGI